MALICPYCDSGEVVVKDTLRITELEPDDAGERMIVVKRCVCRECGEVCYAYRFYRSADAYDCVRRDQLEARTGVRIQRTWGKPKGRRA